MVTATVNRRLYQRIVHLAEQDPLGGSPDIIHIEPPFAEFRPKLEELLANIIVCHDPIRKLSGAFHEETGYGAQLVGDRYRVVYRKPLNEQFDTKQVAKVVDPALRVFLAAHLARFDNIAKVAFSESNRPRLSANKAPIRHVRVVASESMNPESFLPIRINGKVVRLHPFGNNHHVEIVRDKNTGRHKGIFVNTWQAAQRIRGDKLPLVQRDHGPDADFVMALHINDMVSVNRDGRTLNYRVQKLDPTGNRLALRLHTAATLDNLDEGLLVSIQRLVADYQVKPLKLNVLGHSLDDQADY